MNGNLTLQERAQAFCTAQVVSNIRSGMTWKEAYDHLCDCVENEKEPDAFVVFAPFSGYSLAQLLEHIEGGAETLLEQFLEVDDAAERRIVGGLPM